MKAERDPDSATVSFERECVKWEGDTLPTDSDADQETSRLGKPSREKSAVFLNIVQKAFDPPFYLNICPILQGVFFKRVFEH